MQVSQLGQAVRSHSSLDGQDDDKDDSRSSSKRARRNWTRGQAACNRCRKKKTKCSGSFPCERCIRLEVADECTFEEPGAQSSVFERIKALEDCVSRLVNSGHAANPSVSYQVNNTVSPQNMQPPLNHNSNGSSIPTITSPSQIIPQPASQSHRLPSNTTHIQLDPSPGSLSASSMRAVYQEPILPQVMQASQYPTVATLRPNELDRRPPTSSERFEPPFAEVVFNRSVYQAAEISRAPSPSSMVAQETPGGASNDKDVITAGILPVTTAIHLYDLFVRRCLPYLPLFGGATNLPTLQDIRERSPFLASACVAIGARFAAALQMADHIPYTSIADHAEYMLSRTLLRKRHSLEDVQAAVFMSAWGLRSKGGGPDAWMLASHAYAMSARLGLNVAPPAGKQPDVRDIEKARAWLLACAFETFQSVGFGRPGGRTIATTDALLDMLRFQSATSGDILVLALAELAAIADSLVKWQDDMRSNRSRMAAMELFDLVQPQLKDWSGKWTDANSRYICSSTPIVRLYGEHVYLCLALLALRSVKAPTSQTSAGSVDEVMQKAIMRYMTAANRAASAIIRVGTDSGIDSATTFGNEYCTLILAQAALAILSLAGSKHRFDNGSIQQYVELTIDEGGAAYLVRQVISALSENDYSYTRIASFLSTTLNNALEQFLNAPSRRSTSQASFSSQAGPSNSLADTSSLNAMPPIAEGVSDDQWQSQSWFTDFFSNQTDWLVSEQEGSNLLSQPSFMNLWWGEQQQ